MNYYLNMFGGKSAFEYLDAVHSSLNAQEISPTEAAIQTVSQGDMEMEQGMRNYVLKNGPTSVPNENPATIEQALNRTLSPNEAAEMVVKNQEDELSLRIARYRYLNQLKTQARANQTYEEMMAEISARSEARGLNWRVPSDPLGYDSKHALANGYSREKFGGQRAQFMERTEVSGFKGAARLKRFIRSARASSQTLVRFMGSKGRISSVYSYAVENDATFLGWAKKTMSSYNVNSMEKELANMNQVEKAWRDSVGRKAADDPAQKNPSWSERKQILEKRITRLKNNTDGEWIRSIKRVIGKVRGPPPAVPPEMVVPMQPKAFRVSPARLVGKMGKGPAGNIAEYIVIAYAIAKANEVEVRGGMAKDRGQAGSDFRGNAARLRREMRTQEFWVNMAKEAVLPDEKGGPIVQGLQAVVEGAISATKAISEFFGVSTEEAVAVAEIVRVASQRLNEKAHEHREPLVTFRPVIIDMCTELTF